MRVFSKITLMAATLMWGFASPVSAATLTLVDTFGGGTNEVTWTLVVPDGCVTCQVTLDADFSSPTAYAGVYLDSFQWVVTDPNTDIDSISDPDGDEANWNTSEGQVVNANGCTSTGNDAFTCTVWDGLGEGLLISNGDMFSWTFDVTFDSAVTALEGNIRASFDDENGTNFNIFSPGGGTFTTTVTPTTTDEPTTTITPTTTDQPTGEGPEPAVLGLLAIGLLGVSRHLRRRKL